MFIDKSITTQKDWPTNNDQLINNDISGILQRTHYLHFSMNIIVLECTVGDDGSVADISCMSIFSHVQGLLPRRQLAATRWSAQIPVRAHCFGCISQIKFCWKLPHFRSPDIFYFISKLKIVGPLLNNISTQFSEG